jgi:hypothetical protein
MLCGPPVVLADAPLLEGSAGRSAVQESRYPLPRLSFDPYILRVTRPLRGNSGARYYRILNEVPTVLMIGIVILVDFKPF